MMKKKANICAVLLAMFLTVSWIVPAYAEDDVTQPNPTESASSSAPEEQQPSEEESSGSDTDPSNEGETGASEPSSSEQDTASDSPESTAPPEESSSEEGTQPAPDPAEAAPSDLARSLMASENMIDVVVPSTGSMIVNPFGPYGMKVDVDGVSTTDQIIHNAQALVNNSDQAVSVSVRVVGTVPEGSEAILVSSPLTGKTPEKKIFLYTEFQGEPDVWKGVYNGDFNQIAATEEGVEKEDVLTIAPNSEGYFKIFGEMSEWPSPLWKDTDVFRVTLSFSFTAEDANITLPDSEASGKQEANPSDPETPSEPSDTPVEPTEPSDKPTEPIEPSDTPTEPTEPSDTPTEPTEPSDTPTEPTEPSDTPVEPTEPSDTPAEPTEPTEPAENLEDSGQ